ncbi:MAG: CocE/NonD family hydrolase [Oscillospiraceae bacterium]
MKKLLSLLLALTLLCSTLPLASAADAPSEPLSRGAFAELLVKLCNLDGEKAAYAAKPSSFSDIPEGDEYEAAANLLRDKGLMLGDGTGAFHPADSVMLQEAVTVFLRRAGLTDRQLGAWPGDYSAMAASVKLVPGKDYLPASPATAEAVTALAAKAETLRAAITAPVPAPLFVDGVAQPIFPYETMIRQVVYVETPNDTDGDGKSDLVQVLVQRPAATDKGMKAATIYEARPYSAGTTDAYSEDAWNAHVVNAKLEQATTSTKTTKSDWDWKKTAEKPKSPVMRTPDGVGAATAESDVWKTFEHVQDYDYWLVRGYAYATCAGLGTLGSEGFEVCGSHEETQAFAAVAQWLAGDSSVKAYTALDGKTEVKADWSNGNVGMSGQSYAGTMAFSVAATGVPGLKTIVPRAGIASWYDYYRSQGTAAGGLYYPGDDCDILADYCMSRQLDPQEYAGVKTSYEAVLTEMIAAQQRLNGDYNRYWDERNYTNDAKNLKASALIIHGLNDFNVKPKQFDMMYKAFVEGGQTAKLLLHQGAHYTPEQIEQLDLNGILGAWYAHYLYNVDNGAEKAPAVRVQSNLDLSWNTYDSWDDAAKTVTLQAGKGTSNFTSDLSVTSFDTKLADKNDVWLEYVSDAAYAWEQDMLGGKTGASAVYRFDVAEDTHISGTAKVTVKASADRPTGILSAMLVDFAPEGGMNAVVLEQYGERVAVDTVTPAGLWYGGGLPNKDLLQFAQTNVASKVITRGWMDIQNRTSIYNVDTVTPGEFYEFTLALQPIDYVVQKGHQLGLALYSTDVEVTYWPEAVTNFTVDNAGTSVVLPIR